MLSKFFYWFLTVIVNFKIENNLRCRASSARNSRHDFPDHRSKFSSYFLDDRDVGLLLCVYFGKRATHDSFIFPRVNKSAGYLWLIGESAWMPGLFYMARAFRFVKRWRRIAARHVCPHAALLQVHSRKIQPIYDTYPVSDIDRVLLSFPSLCVYHIIYHTFIKSLL